MPRKEVISINESKDNPCFFFTYNSVGSTNDLARKKVGKYKQFAILARKQNKGRGRYDRTFLSLKDRGIYLTIGVETEKDLQIVSQYSVYVALAAKRVLEKNGSERIQFKWPNDLQIKGKKCAGILCESVICGASRFAIVGIGINLFYKQEEFGELQTIATSIFSSEHPNKKEQVSKIAQEITREFFRICEEPQNDIYEEYCEACDIVGKRIEHLGQIGEVLSIEQDMSITVSFGGVVKKINYGEIILQD